MRQAACQGSTGTARRINLELACPPGPIVRFIAETGAQNATIVDCSLLAEQVAATGDGLTLGIPRRIDETVRHILARLRVGNSYVNRSMIGAVVGCSPSAAGALRHRPQSRGPR